MATVTILQPVAEEAEFRKKEAQQHWKAIQQSGPLVSTNSLRIGYHAAALKREGLFGILGYENEKQAQEASGVKQATWFNVMRIAEAFPGVEEKLFLCAKIDQRRSSHGFAGVEAAYGILAAAGGNGFDRHVQSRCG